MSRLSRREFLRVTAATAATGGVAAASGGLLPGCDPRASERVFPQGVASGDPQPGIVVLWTRVAPRSPGAVEPLRYEVAQDPGFGQRVARGTLTALPDFDHTVRLKVTGLNPGATYYYRFHARGTTSPTGRTKTAPAPDADVAVRLAVTYGQSYVGRYFQAYRTLLAEEVEAGAALDFVIFLGDYIYEVDQIEGAQDPTADRHVTIPDGLLLGETRDDGLAALTLRDYRTLYRAWHTDPDLQRARRLLPFVTMWDDHEFANDCWQDHANDFNGARGDEQNTVRRKAATRAFWEYVPVDPELHPDAPFPEDLTLYRSFRYGRHLELFLTDQRIYRDDHVIPEGPRDPEVGKTQENSIVGSRILVLKEPFDEREAAVAPTMLGTDQRAWLLGGVRGSTATWKVIGSPTIVSQMLLDLANEQSVPNPLRKTFYFKVDQWDGYRSERAALLSALSDVENLVFLTGDIHASFVSDLHVDFDAPGPAPVSVEYIGPSISAVSLQEQLGLAIAQDPLLSLLGLEPLVADADRVFAQGNPHYHYVNTAAYGYAVAEVDRDQELRVTLVHLPGVGSPAETAPTERVRFRTPTGRAIVERL